MERPLVGIFGSGDRGTACALRLFRSGFRVILFTRQPVYDLHHHRTFSRAVFNGYRNIDNVAAGIFSHCTSEGIVPVDADLKQFVSHMLLSRRIPILLPDQVSRNLLTGVSFAVVFDVELYKQLKSHFDEEMVCIAAGALPDAHYRIIEEGPQLGQVVYAGEVTTQRKAARGTTLIKAPIEGVFEAKVRINQEVFLRDAMAVISDIPILAPENGIVTGLLPSGLMVESGRAIVEITSRRFASDARILPAEAFALAGGVLEAILHHWHP